MYPMPYAWFLDSCSMGSHMVLLLFLDLAFPSVIALDSPRIAASQISLWGSVAPFYLGYSPIESGDSLSGYVHPRMVCLAFWASDWLGVFWASCLVIHPSMTFVKLFMIGYCCDHLVGGLNCLVSTCWLIVISNHVP